MLNTLIAGLFAFIGSMLGQYLIRKSSKETDIWRKREETYRMLRYAIDLTNSNNQEIIRKGICILDSLAESELLQKEDEIMLKKITFILVYKNIK